MLVACENRRKRTCLIFPFFTFGTPQLEMPTHLVFQHLQTPPPPPPDNYCTIPKSKIPRQMILFCGGSR